MRLVIHTHDTYIASPNMHTGHPPGFNVHNMGCMFIPPHDGRPDTPRGLTPAVRAAKLREIWRQLDELERLHGCCGSSGSAGQFFVGDTLTLADFAVFPTFVYFVFYLPRVFRWKEGPFHGRPRLRSWFDRLSTTMECFRKVRAEMEEVLHRKITDGSLDVLVRETEENREFKWIYP